MEEKVIITAKKEYLSSEKEEIKQSFRRRLLIVFLCFLLAIATFTGGYFSYKLFHPSYSINEETTLGEIEYILDHYWLYSNNYDDFIKSIEDKAFYGMSFFPEDPYTTYMSYDESTDFYSSINMNYVGIGVQYESIDNVNTIKKVFKDSPAFIAGLLVGDIIEKVDGTSVDGLNADEIKQLVLGEKGSKVTISVKRGIDYLDIPVYRDAVDSSVYAYTQDDYVVLQLLSFGLDTGKNTMKYLDEYLDYDKLIIDLRDNTGGYQASVEEIAGLFIGNNEVYMKQVDKNGNEVIDKTHCEKTYDNFRKIIVLTNSQTASAAEVLTICLKEKNENVTLVGTTTFGKGVVQSEFKLSNGASLKVTNTKWLSPNGVWINGEGIKPDEEVFLHDVLYETFYVMSEQEQYEYDDVSNYVKVCQLALDYLGYDVDRFDGYFDESFLEALNEFKTDNNLESDGILDKDTYSLIYSKTSIASIDPAKDSQMLRAIELLGE